MNDYARHEHHDFTGATPVKHAGGDVLLILVLKGRKFRIGQSWLPSKAAFEDVQERLRAGMRSRTR